MIANAHGRPLWSRDFTENVEQLQLRRPTRCRPRSTGGLDAILSVVQMPPGVPVAAVGLDNPKNAGHLALRILGRSGYRSLVTNAS